MPAQPVILQVIPQLETGGAERTVIDIAEAVRMAGGLALVASEGGRMEAELAAAGGELIRIPAAAKNPLTLIANARELEALIAERGVSLVHARSRAPAWSALMAARRAGAAFVTTYHGVYNQKGAIKGWYNGVMARGDAVIANSHYTAGIVRQRHGTPDARLTVIHRGVDLARFSPEAVSRARIAGLRARWGVGETARLVVLAARLTRWKGQLATIGAASLVLAQPELADVVFILAGDDQGRRGYRDELAARIEALGLSGRVLLTGHCDDMPAAFGAATLALVPSIEPEAFGRTSVEAQAMGCPVIVNDIGALPETIDAGAPTGWTAQPGDEADLARTIAAALSLGPDRLDAIGRTARHHAATGFSKAMLQGRTLEVYDKLLGSSLAQALDQKLWANEDFMPSPSRIPV